MQELKVSDVMRDCQTSTVRSSITVREAAERLMVNDSAVLIAVDEEGRLAGQVSESDIVRQLLVSESTTASIEPILTCYVESVYQTASVSHILHLFRSSCHEALPVLKEDRTVVGILSRHDIVKLLLSDQPLTESKKSPSLKQPYFTKKTLRNPKAADSTSKPHNGDEMSAGQ